MPDLLPILADFMADIKRAAYPDLVASVGESCILLTWKSHTLTAWVDLMNGTGMTITHDESEQEIDGGPYPLATVADLIVEHINETGTACGEGHRDAEPGTFAALVWVTLYQTRIARLDPEGRYSVKQSEPLITLAKFTDDDANF